MIETTDVERVGRGSELPAPLLPLERLAWNYWWSWAADGESVFRDLDPEIWEDFRVAAIRRKYPTTSKALQAAIQDWLERGSTYAA